MAKLLKLRRGTDTQHASFTTGEVGEITVNTTNNSIHVHDGGTTTGGTELARADLSNAAGANIPGTLTANNLVVDDDGGGDPTVMIKADDATPYALIVRNDTYSTAANTGFGVIQANAGDVNLDFRGNAEFKNVRLRQSDNSTTTEFIHVDTNRAVHVKHDGSNKLSTTSTGVNVTGRVTCDGITNDGDILVQAGTGTLVLRDVDSGNATAATNQIKGQSSDGVDRWYIGDLSSGTAHFDIMNRAGAELRFGTNDTIRATFNGAGHFVPNGDNTYDIGESGNEWRNAYFDGTVNCDGLQCDGGAQIAAANGILTLKDTDSSGTGNNNYVRGYASDNTQRWYVGHASDANNDLYVGNSTSANIRFDVGGSTKVYIDSSGNLNPNSNNAYDLGTSSLRWRNVYTNDLNLSNEGGTNDVDGTWGSWTIQEGEDDLFLLNRRNGKKYKFNLSEVN